MKLRTTGSRRSPACIFWLPSALVLLAAGACAFGQESSPYSAPFALPQTIRAVSLDTLSPQESPEENQPEASGGGSTSSEATIEPKDQGDQPLHPQPKRILGIMPNFRAVSAGIIPPPPTPKQALGIATRNSFDYSSFVFTGLTSLLAEGTDAHPPLGNGIDGFGRYYWRGFADKTTGNYLVIFALPTIFHQDERYFALGQGSKWKRLAYSVSRVVITPNYQGHDSFNASELLGRGIAQGISLSYYPSQTRTASELAAKYGYAILRDALTNAFREFWPDIAVHVLHRNP